MATAPFHVSPELTAIAIAYRNPVTDYIADLVMPRTRPVGKLEFSYTVYDLSAFNRPNTFVGRKGRPNEVTMSSTTQTAAIEDFGLDDLIPMSDIEQGRAIGRDIQAESVEYIMGLVKLDRECRVAAAAQNAANFTNTATLSGSNQWSHADSKPLTALLEYLDTPMMRPNTMILSAPVWSKLRTHPQIVKAIYPISAEGAVTRQQLADLLTRCAGECCYLIRRHHIGITLQHEQIELVGIGRSKPVLVNSDIVRFVVHSNPFLQKAALRRQR